MILRDNYFKNFPDIIELFLNNTNFLITLYLMLYKFQ